MAVHLVLIACLAAPGSAKAKSEEWQAEHKDYLVIATKCAKDDGGSAPPPPPPANSN